MRPVSTIMQLSSRVLTVHFPLPAPTLASALFLLIWHLFGFHPHRHHLHEALSELLENLLHLFCHLLLLRHLLLLLLCNLQENLIENLLS